MIKSFRGQYRFLSNFHPARVVWEGAEYPTVEHAYQASKTQDLGLRDEIRCAPKAGIAKRMGRDLPLRTDWEEIKLNVMLQLLRLKFADHALGQALLRTGIAYLEEGNDWGDKFWGVCQGQGENYLGRLLMGVRTELRVQQELQQQRNGHNKKSGNRITR